MERKPKYKVMHEGGCERVAFYSHVDHSDGNKQLKSEDIVLVDGSTPKAGDPIKCSSCGGSMKKWWKYEEIGISKLVNDNAWDTGIAS
jgi:hypothetical protein